MFDFNGKEKHFKKGFNVACWAWTIGQRSTGENIKYFFPGLFMNSKDDTEYHKNGDMEFRQSLTLYCMKYKTINR